MRPQFGSATAGHRDAIRADLIARLELTDPTPAMDLSRPPAPDAWSVSISHAPDLGGWLAAPRPAQIGFDVEQRDRVREAVIRRVCSPAEVELVGDFALLWAAKEALFKALARGQPAVMSQLTVTQWDAGDDGLCTFTSAAGRRTLGFAQVDARHAAAVCIVPG